MPLTYHKYHTRHLLWRKARLKSGQHRFPSAGSHEQFRSEVLGCKSIHWHREECGNVPNGMCYSSNIPFFNASWAT